MADRIGVSHSQISRLESEATTNIDSFLLTDLAKKFQLSTDYLLCLTLVSVPKSHNISQLGLSEEVVRRLILKTIDPVVLNRLLEHKDFPKLCDLMKNYFSGTTASGILARNQVIDLATEPVADLMSSDLAKKGEILKDLTFLNTQKIQSNEADIEKIKNSLMKILWDIKADMEAEQAIGPIATVAAVQGIRAALPDKPQSELTAEDVSAAVAAYVGIMLPMDESTATLLQQLTKQMLEPTLETEN